MYAAIPGVVVFLVTVFYSRLYGYALFGVLYVVFLLCLLQEREEQSKKGIKKRRRK